MDTQYLSYLEPKGEVICCKIDWLAATFISKFKWAWQAQFLSYTLLILEINVFFQVVWKTFNNILLSLMVSDLAKSVGSVPSILKLSLYSQIYFWFELIKLEHFQVKNGQNLIFKLNFWSQSWSNWSKKEILLAIDD